MFTNKTAPLVFCSIVALFYSNALYAETYDYTYSYLHGEPEFIAEVQGTTPQTAQNKKESTDPAVTDMKERIRKKIEELRARKEPAQSGDKSQNGQQGINEVKPNIDTSAASSNNTHSNSLRDLPTTPTPQAQVAKNAPLPEQPPANNLDLPPMPAAPAKNAPLPEQPPANNLDLHPMPQAPAKNAPLPEQHPTNNLDLPPMPQAPAKNAPLPEQHPTNNLDLPPMPQAPAKNAPLPEQHPANNLDLPPMPDYDEKIHPGKVLPPTNTGSSNSPNKAQPSTTASMQNKQSKSLSDSNSTKLQKDFDIQNFDQNDSDETLPNTAGQPYKGQSMFGMQDTRTEVVEEQRLKHEARAKDPITKNDPVKAKPQTFSQWKNLEPVGTDPRWSGTHNVPSRVLNASSGGGASNQHIPQPNTLNKYIIAASAYTDADDVTKLRANMDEISRMQHVSFVEALYSIQIGDKQENLLDYAIRQKKIHVIKFLLLNGMQPEDTPIRNAFELDAELEELVLKGTQFDPKDFSPQKKSELHRWATEQRRGKSFAYGDN